MMPRFMRIFDNKIFRESTHQRYYQISPGYLLRIFSFAAAVEFSYLRVYIYSQALLSQPITLLALWVYWQYIVLTLKTFIWSHQCNIEMSYKAVQSPDNSAAASQCNIKNIMILHSSRMQRLLLNQGQKNLMNKLKQNETHIGITL